MSREEILKKVIEKAITSGWNMFGFNKPEFDWNTSEQEFGHQTWLYCYRPNTGTYPGKFSLNDIVFSKDFAKAFWKTEVAQYSDADNDFLEPWQYHLKQMVLEEDYIRYLERFI